MTHCEGNQGIKKHEKMSGSFHNRPNVDQSNTDGHLQQNHELRSTGGGFWIGSSLPRSCGAMDMDDFLLYYKFHEASIRDFISNLIGDPLLSCRSQAATESFALKDSTFPEKHPETSAKVKHSAEAGKE